MRRRRPGGPLLRILAKRRFPAWSIRVLERNRPLDTFGWGVVFSDATLETLRAADEPTHRAITQAFAHWDDIEIHFKGDTIRSGGHGFSGIARKRLLAILQERATELGVELCFKPKSKTSSAERVNCRPACRSRRDQQSRAPDVCRCVQAQSRPAALPLRVAWYDLPLDAFTFIFEHTEHGWFTVHAYRFDEERAPSSWSAARRPGSLTGSTHAGTGERSRFVRLSSRHIFTDTGSWPTRPTCAGAIGSTSRA